jgi:hypothetical protein
MSNPSNMEAQLAALQAELDAVKRREADYRVAMVKEFLDKGERNTYLHVLHEERAELLKRQHEAFLDLEALTRKVEVEEARARALEAELARIKDSAAWKVAGAFLPSRGPEPAPTPSGYAPIEGAPFTYYLHTSPFRIYRGTDFTLRGWAWPEDGRAITAVRVALGGRLYEGKIGFEEPEVVARYGLKPANPKPGFEVRFETPAGRHAFSLEAQLGGVEWRWIMRTTIWCEPAL